MEEWKERKKVRGEKNNIIAMRGSDFLTSLIDA